MFEAGKIGKCEDLSESDKGQIVTARQRSEHLQNCWWASVAQTAE